MKQIILISVMLISIFACTKQQPIKSINSNNIVVPTNKLLDKTWYLYSRNNVLTNNKFTTRDYQSAGQLVTDNGNTAYTTTDYWTFKYQVSGQFPNDTITFINDTMFLLESYQPAMGIYVDRYKLK